MFSCQFISPKINVTASQGVDLVLVSMRCRPDQRTPSGIGAANGCRDRKHFTSLQRKDGRVRKHRKVNCFISILARVSVQTLAVVDPHSMDSRPAQNRIPEKFVNQTRSSNTKSQQTGKGLDRVRSKAKCNPCEFMQKLCSFNSTVVALTCSMSFFAASVSFLV